jgi:hypothetical protein
MARNLHLRWSVERIRKTLFFQSLLYHLPFVTSPIGIALLRREFPELSRRQCAGYLRVILKTLQEARYVESLQLGILAEPLLGESPIYRYPEDSIPPLGNGLREFETDMKKKAMGRLPAHVRFRKQKVYFASRKASNDFGTKRVCLDEDERSNKSSWVHLSQIFGGYIVLPKEVEDINSLGYESNTKLDRKTYSTGLLNRYSTAAINLGYYYVRLVKTEEPPWPTANTWEFVTSDDALGGIPVARFYQDGSAVGVAFSGTFSLFVAERIRNYLVDNPGYDGVEYPACERFEIW